MDRFRTKQSSEAYYVEFDYKDKIGTTIIIASAVVTAKVVSTGVDATAVIITAANQSISGQSVYVWVKAGASGTDYQITCVATGDDGSVHELEGLMLVSDIPASADTLTGPGLLHPPVIEPVSLAETKLHLYVDDTDHDTMIASMIKAAREHVETITRRALLTQTWQYCLSAWPDMAYFKLPLGCLQSVTSVKWKDEDGTETTLVAGTDYIVQTNGEYIGMIVLPSGVSWPSGTLYPANPITIEYVCGWTTAELVPYAIKAACLLIIADLYQMRGEPVIGQSVVENKAAQRLLATYRLWDEFSCR